MFNQTVFPLVLVHQSKLARFPLIDYLFVCVRELANHLSQSPYLLQRTVMRFMEVW